MTIEELKSNINGGNLKDGFIVSLLEFSEFLQSMMDFQEENTLGL